MNVEQWLSTELGQKIWNNKYRNDSESLDQWFDRVSGNNEDVKRLIQEHKFLFGGRTLSNRGLNNGSYSNCYSSGYVPDNLTDIMRINTNLALTYKAQGGQGASLSKIRPKGCLIGGRYESDGIVPFMEMFNVTTSSLKQGGSRKGALMLSIDITHKEADTFITIKSDLNRINNANLSVEIDDDFMGIVEESYKTNTEIVMNCTKVYGSQTIEYTIVPIKLYKLLIKQAHLSAEPGVIFTNKFRNYNLMEFVDKYQIETCNPCLHPDSVIETSEGKVKIKDMTKSMMVYSMDEDLNLVLKKATPSWISKLSAKTINIEINNGQVLTCTPDHKIYIQNKGWVEAKDVKLGDSPVALLRRRRGAKYSGVRLSTQQAGSDIMEHRFIYQGHYGEIEKGCDIHHLDNDSYNNVVDNLQCLSHSEHATITRNECDNNHQIQGENGRFVNTGGTKPKTIIPLPEDLCTNFKSKPRIVKISDGVTTDVYDITVEDTHCLIADGIIVHNCGEQPLPANGACNLGSINLSKYVKWHSEQFDFVSFKNDVNICVRALDDIIDENLNNHALPEQREMSFKYRNIGLGIMGFADMFIKMGITYGSKESIELTDKILKQMFKYSVEASISLAIEKGSFPEYTPEVFDSAILKNVFTEEELYLFKQLGIRNCSLLSIAPTGSLGTMLNISTGIEPNFAFSFVRKTESLEGNKESFHDVFAGIALEYSTLYSPLLPDYFVTSHNVNWEDRINIQGVAQKYIDTAISATINLPENISVNEVEKLYLKAWKAGLKGITIYRDKCREGILNLTQPSKKTDNFADRPNTLEAQVIHFINEGKPWVAFIGTKENKPFEIFTGPHDLETFPVPKSVTSGTIIKVKNGTDTSRYDFQYTDKYGYTNTLGGLSRNFDKEYWNYARLLSGLLRNQVDVAWVLDIVEGMYSDSESLHSWKNGVMRALKIFIPDGTSTGEKCPECENDIIFTGGCKQCSHCGWSKCS